MGMTDTMMAMVVMKKMRRARKKGSSRPGQQRDGRKGEGIWQPKCRKRAGAFLGFGRVKKNVVKIWGDQETSGRENCGKLCR